MSRREPGPDGASALSTVCVSMRGEIVVVHEGIVVPLRPKERAVLAAIALAHPQPIGIDRIAELVWGDATPATARKTVQNHVARIRRSIDGLVDTSELGYRFADGVVIDPLHTSGSGIPLADLPDTPEIDAHRQRLRTQAVAAEEEHWATELAEGATSELVSTLHAAAHSEPYRERRWHLLASAHAALGARREALRACEAARRQLAEVGLVPGEELRSLEQRLLADDPAPRVPMVPIRPVVHPHRQEPFVGRSGELTRLADAWRRAAEHHKPRLVVVRGPAGAGKTRLVDEFCRTLPDDTVVLVARHRPGGDRALAPIADAIHPVLEEPDPAMSGGSGPPTRVLVEAVRSTLQRLADRPHVVVLDDVHWATSDAIDVVADAIDGIDTPTLVLLTSRPPDTDTGGDTWLPLSAVAAMEHVSVAELTRSELGQLVDAAGLEVLPDVDLVYARTAGLPYYASELLRLARPAGRLDMLDVPSAVRTWMQQRLASLDDDAADVARIAAVAGPLVDTELLAEVAGRTADDVAADCDRLVDGGLLAADVDTGTLRFGHELGRDAIIESIGPATLAGLHRRIAAALEGDGSAEPALLAHHLVRGGPSVACRAASAATRAGERDLASGAWRQAETWFRTSLELTENDHERARALAGLGRSLLGSERFEASEAALRSAIDLARAHGLATVQASATLALAGRAGRGAGIASDDAEITALLRSALDHIERAPTDELDSSDHRARTALTCAVERELAIALLLDDAVDERTRLLHRQLERARALDPADPGELASALLAFRYAQLDGASLRQRLGDVGEVLSLPAASIGPERLLTAQCYRHEDLLRSGDRARAAAALSDAEGLVRRFPHPYWNWVTRTWRAVEHVNAGALEAAEQLALDAAGLRAGIDEAAACFGVNLVNIRLYQRRAGEVVPLLRDAVDAHPHIPAYRAVLALCSAEAGDLDGAAAHVHHFTSERLRNLPDDTNRQLALAVLAHAAAVLGDDVAADQLRTALDPFAGQWVVLACYGGGGAVWGPVDHALGLLAAVAGRFDEAAQLLDRAETQAAGAPIVLERIRGDRSVALRPVGSTRRRRPADRAAS